MLPADRSIDAFIFFKCFELIFKVVGLRPLIADGRIQV